MMLPVARILLVPGRSAASPDHWQSRWAADHPEYRWVPRPSGPLFDLDLRVAALHRAVTASDEPAVLVAHSAGCIAAVVWASLHAGPVKGALLVAPPYIDPEWKPGPDDPDEPAVDVPRHALPFPAILVASRTDPYAEFEESRDYALDWGAQLIDAGDAGHLHSAAGYGPWPAGEQLLKNLL
jgi:uncharacterized protein